MRGGGGFLRLCGIIWLCLIAIFAVLDQAIGLVEGSSVSSRKITQLRSSQKSISASTVRGPQNLGVGRRVLPALGPEWRLAQNATSPRRVSHFSGRRVRVLEFPSDDRVLSSTKHIDCPHYKTSPHAFQQIHMLHRM